ncbi:MAG: SRPBCC family protein [Chloroflexota bacterium]
MARYTAVIRSARSAFDTFAYMADFTNAAAWDPGVLAARRLDEGPAAIGSRFALDFRFGGSTVPLEYKILALEPGRAVTLRAERPAFIVEDVITVEPDSSGALVRYQATMSLRGPMRLLSPVLGLVFRRGAAQAGRSLARQLGG